MATKRFQENAPTLREIWEYTYDQYRSRFDNRDRDVIKKLIVDEVTELLVDRLDVPMKKYRITTHSYPQYKPYDKIKGKKSKNQRTIRHQYDITLELEELSLDSRFNWRVGSQKKWPKTIAQKFVQTIRRETLANWKKKYDSDRIRKLLKRHRSSAKYLNNGDYVSRALGINGDFYWRLQAPLYKAGVLYGLCWEKNSDNTDIFFDKHTIRVLEYMMEKKIISY
ncbi:MAG: hypothetical protein PF569_00045 [Candidatus Woesearchaeota archaeon]|jgi:hypothetical protein|nr:hypothetical protein [Candidatus Woesearchaeota archaeon]